MKQPDADDGPGNVSYLGYEYQIAVTAWLALDLMVARRAAKSVLIEPRSHEDLEAYLDEDHEPNVVGVEGSLLTVQIKSRSTGPWTAGGFLGILQGNSPVSDNVLGRKAKSGRGAPPPVTKRPGPAPRPRPLALLQADPRRRFVFITDAAVEAGLRDYVIDLVGGTSAAKKLPAQTGKSPSAGDVAPLSRRITILEKLTSETIANRTERLLLQHGQVPLVRCEACRTAVVEAVRARLGSLESRRLNLDELVDILRAHEGSPIVDALSAAYVAPRCLGAIEKMLSERHAVIIMGPPGTGKTMTADVMEQRFRSEGTGFQIVGKGIRPHGVPDNLRSPGPVLFHLRDPWGEIGPSQDAEAWSDALLKQLPQARSDKKFLITTRSDLLPTIDGHAEALLSFAVRIDPEDYDDAAKAAIYDGRLERLHGRAKTLGHYYRDRVLRALVKPFELDRFFVNLRESAESEPELAQLIRNSQTEAIAGVVQGQVLAIGASDKAVAAVATLWALTSTVPDLREDVLEEVRRRMMRLDPTFGAEIGLVLDRMVRSRNVERTAGSISIPHPQIELGFRKAMLSRPTEAETALNLLVRALVDLDGDDAERAEGWGADLANQLRLNMGEFVKLKLDLTSDVARMLDERLEARVLTITGPGFAKALDDLAFLGGKSIMARFARTLRTRSGKPRAWGYGWSLPEGAMAEAPSFGADKRCREIARRVILDVLPHATSPTLPTRQHISWRSTAATRPSSSKPCQPTAWHTSIRPICASSSAEPCR